jgi:hypothetical protein
MALEAWAHRRIEAGDEFDAVLNDVLGPPGSSAAFVLIAVDLIISHWPSSQTAAVPFLGCPELVSLDRTRQTQDQIVFPDFFGLSALEKEPAGPASRESLKQRPSRGLPLERLVGIYAFGPESLRVKLEQLLQSASQRLGTPEATSNFADPRFMAQHELNLIDPTNWPERQIQRQDGITVTGREYVSPETEAQHLAALTAQAGSRFEAANVRTALLAAIDDPSRSSAALAARGVTWARAHASASKTTDSDEEENFVSGEGIRAAALLAIRDGSDDLRYEHGAWAEQTLIDALSARDHVAHRVRGGLRFNRSGRRSLGL